MTTSVLHLLLIGPTLLMLLLNLIRPLILRYIFISGVGLAVEGFCQCISNVSHLSARCMLFVGIYDCKIAGTHVQEIFKGEEGEGPGKELSDQLPP